MNTKTLLTSLALTALLAACGTGSTTGPYGDKDAAWFRAHPAERLEQVTWCHQTAGQGILTGPPRQVCGIAYNSTLLPTADQATKIKADQKAAATQFYKPFPTYH